MVHTILMPLSGWWHGPQHLAPHTVNTQILEILISWDPVNSAAKTSGSIQSALVLFASGICKGEHGEKCKQKKEEDEEKGKESLFA